MRNIDESQWVIWENGDFTGPNRPVTRAIIQKSVLKQDGNFRTVIFDQQETWYEIPNIMTCTIDRRLSADAATMQLTFANLESLSVNTNLDQPYDPSLIAEQGASVPTRRQLGDLGRPGLYSYRRGITPDSAIRWGHDSDPTWVDMFIPNRVVRTFQGYGTDGAVNAWQDTRLTATGIWLIDRVEYTAKGTITLHCRDLAKLLIEQRLYPPIVPADHYIEEGGLKFCTDHTTTETVTRTGTTTTESTVETTVETPGTLGADVGRHVSSGWDSSVAPWYGYNGSVYGHRASHAFDSDGSTYWLSVGNSGPTHGFSYEWIEADTRGEPVNRVRFKQKWGGYKVYVCVKENGKWQGSSVVPYDRNAAAAYPNGSDTPYVLVQTTPSGDRWVNIDLPRDYNAQRVRLTFTNLQYSGLGTWKYRAAVYEMQCRYYTPSTSETIEETLTETTTETYTEDVTTFHPGNITDYTDIIKVLCAWSGFWWPNGPDDSAIAQFSGTSSSIGRVWGDFFYSGAGPVEPPCIPPSFWDNKSVMDGVNQIKEILGFIFYIDSTGGVVWRMPNIWRTGNFITGTGYIGQDSVREVSEEQVLIDFGVQIDDTNLRSEIIVVSADDPTLHTSLKPGWGSEEVIPSAVNPEGDLALLGGQQRIMLVPNYPFLSQAEVDKFAYLVSLWIHWSYRKSRFRIPGMPAFEPDDQVRIYERVTSESYVHYIQSVRSSMDMNSGTWFCDIDTHWLGAGPDAQWLVTSFSDMPPSLFAYLHQVGVLGTGEGEGGGSDESEWPLGLPPNWQTPTFPIEVPRDDTDLNELFPDPPPIDYADIDVTWSDTKIETTYGGTTPPGGGVYYGTSDWRKAYWGTAPGSLTTIPFVQEWKSYFANLPYDDQIAAHSHPDQTHTRSTRVATRAVAAFKLLAEILCEEKVNVYSCTSYNYRNIAGTNRLSSHSWGLAIDINPEIFTCCSLSVTRSVIAGRTDGVEFLKAGDRIINQIRTVNGNKRVFGWGGKWTSKKDWMHFEVIVTPADLAGGVYR